MLWHKSHAHNSQKTRQIQDARAKTRNVLGLDGWIMNVKGNTCTQTGCLLTRRRSGLLGSCITKTIMKSNIRLSMLESWCINNSKLMHTLDKLLHKEQIYRQLQACIAPQQYREYTPCTSPDTHCHTCMHRPAAIP
jgi:hypothetical protein